MHASSLENFPGSESHCPLAQKVGSAWEVTSTPGPLIMTVAGIRMSPIPLPKVHNSEANRHAQMPMLDQADLTMELWPETALLLAYLPFHVRFPQPLVVSPGCSSLITPHLHLTSCFRICCQGTHLGPGMEYQEADSTKRQDSRVESFTSQMAVETSLLLITGLLMTHNNCCIID